MPKSKFDAAFRKLLPTKFFSHGWGSPDTISRLFDFRKIISNRETCYNLVPKDHPITIVNRKRLSDCHLLEGKFQSPFSLYQPEIASKEIEEAHFQMVLPLTWKNDQFKPVCIHLAGTGDHYFWRRRQFMVKPLLKEGIGAIILENPFYGLRKPKSQIRSNLHYVSDIFVMGGCLILECIALLNWCEQMNLGPLGVTGISMGGHMASLAATNWPKPLVLVPCLSWSTASSAFTEGVLSESIDWDLLQDQYLSNDLYCNTLSKLCKIVDNPFACSLSRMPDYDIDMFLEKIVQNEVLYYKTPHDILNFINNAITSCSTIGYKHSSQTSNLFLVKYNRVNAIEMKKRDKEALWFMRGIMDECTHLKNFSAPVDTSLIIATCAKDDGYVPRAGVSTLDEIWPGATIKYIDCGHVTACLLHRKVFVDSIVEAFARAKTVS